MFRVIITPPHSKLIHWHVCPTHEAAVKWIKYAQELWGRKYIRVSVIEKKQEVAA